MDTLDKIIGGGVAALMAGFQVFGYSTKQDKKICDERCTHLTDGVKEMKNEVKGELRDIHKSIDKLQEGMTSLLIREAQQNGKLDAIVKPGE